MPCSQILSPVYNSYFKGEFGMPCLEQGRMALPEAVATVAAAELGWIRELKEKPVVAAEFATGPEAGPEAGSLAGPEAKPVEC